MFSGCGDGAIIGCGDGAMCLVTVGMELCV